jgi:hypothetical protein
MLLQPKPVEIETQDGSKKSFVLHKFPALAGREIVSQYPITAIPKIGDYNANEAVMLKLMAYVGVPRDDGSVMPLNSRALVDNHVPDFEALLRLEAAMIEYNCSFFANGKASGFFELIATKAQQLLSQTLTDFAARSSAPDKQRTTS